MKINILEKGKNRFKSMIKFLFFIFLYLLIIIIIITTMNGLHFNSWYIHF